MAHADAGRYAAKHPPGGSPDERIAEAIRGKIVVGKLGCGDAERLGAALGVAMAEIGRTADLLEIRIDRCQLGLFGHLPGGKLVRPAEPMAQGVEEAIRDRLSGGRLSCTAAWEISGMMKIARLEVASACEVLKIKIKPCQLGAF